MKKIVYLLFFLVFIAPASVFAEPGRLGIIINEKTDECASFWEGDEFTSYNPPQDWKSYYPIIDENNRAIIKTDKGLCDFDRNEIKNCCQQLGLSFSEIDYREQDSQKFYNNKIIIFVILIAVLGLFFGILKRMKTNLQDKKTTKNQKT